MNLLEIMTNLRTNLMQQMTVSNFVAAWTKYEKTIWDTKPSQHLSAYYVWLNQIQAQNPTKSYALANRVLTKLIGARKTMIETKKAWTEILHPLQSSYKDNRIVNYFINFKLKFDPARNTLINALKTQTAQIYQTIQTWSKNIKQPLTSSQLIQFLKTKTTHLTQLVANNKKLTNISQLAAKIVNKISYQVVQLTQKTAKIIKFVAKGLKLVMKFLKMFTPILMVATEALSFLLDMFLPQTKNFSYTYQPKQGSAYTWNGGSQTTMLWELATLKANTIENMQLVEPIKLQDPQLETFYYYHQTKFKTLEAVKRAAIRKFLNNPQQQKFANLAWEYDFGSSTNSFADLTTMTNAVIQDLALRKEDSIYYGDAYYQYGKITSKDYQSLKAYGIKKILDELQPTWIVQLPVVDANNYVVFDQKRFWESKFKDDGSVKNFMIPGKIWNPITNSVNTMNQNLNKTGSNVKYIINNYNKLISSRTKEATTANQKINLANQNKIINDYLNTKVQQKINDLQFAFANQFQVQQKTVITSSLTNFPTFSAIKSDVTNYQVYQISDRNNSDYYFLSKPEAIRYYVAQNHLEVMNLAPVIQEFWFKNQRFDSMDVIYQHVFNTIKNSQKVAHA